MGNNCIAAAVTTLQVSSGAGPFGEDVGHSDDVRAC
jgi:hypothetical protein